MRKTLLILFVIIIGYFLVIGNKQMQKSKQLKNKYKDFSTIDYKLENKDYKLLLADTPAKWEKGLMHFRSLEDVDGMIFIFPDKERRTFWNKNTLMNLQLLWIKGDRIVGKSRLPSIEESKKIVTVNSPALVNKVIELPLKSFDSR